jgi:predicted transcriptional regulator
VNLPTPEDLLERREELGLTQSELAERAGVSQPLIARIEGDDVDPRLSTLRRIVNALEEAEGGVVRAEDVMHEGIVSVAPDDAVSEAVDRMDSEAYSQLPVLDNGVPVGSISYTDVSQAGGETDDVGSFPVSSVMSESFPSVAPDATVERIQNLLDYYKAVVVTDGGTAVGIVTEADLATAVS